MTRLVPIGLVMMLAAVFFLAGARGAWVRVTDEDRRVVAELTRNVKTYCIGRFLIDVPEEMKIELRQARIHGFELAAFDETEEEFQKRVADRESQGNPPKHP